MRDREEVLRAPHAHGRWRCRPAGHRATVSVMNAPETGAHLSHVTGAGPPPDPPGRTRLRQLADQQAALRRVATLVARAARPAEVFTAVADELGQLIGAAATFVSRVDPPLPSPGGPGGPGSE